MTKVKICGLTTPETVKTASEAGVDFLGFVFYPPSPRNISPQNAGALIKDVPEHVQSVGLFVDPTNVDIEQTLKHAALDMIQLHGSETSERLHEIKEHFGLPLIKAIRVGSKSDLENIESFEPYVAWLLFDAKPERAELPGGTGHVFDWSLLDGLEIKTPWMLSGGLSLDNLDGAVSHLHPPGVDVSSGVESAKGVKDSNKITNFINIAKTSS